MYQVLFSNYLLQLPSLAVLIIGLVIAIGRRRQHPRVSTFGAIGLGIFIMRLLLGPAIRFWIDHSGAPLAEIGARFAIYNIASSLLAAAAWILLLMAIFRWRQWNATG